MTELETIVVDKMMQNGLIKFYSRYVDDTLVVVKPEHINSILDAFNKFDKNLEFTVDKFENCVPHFLDLEIHPEGLSILGISFSGAGNAKREFADEGDREHNPRQLSCQVSNT